ncbi:MAG: DUF99 family protein [Halobacteriales archaeon]
MNLDKPGVRVLGVAESHRGREGDEAVVAGVVYRVDRGVETLAYSSISVGGLDATDGVVELHDKLDRDDVSLALVSGIALAWYNVVDLDRVARETDLPVVSVSYEESDGLSSAIESEFTGDEATRRLELYERQRERTETTLETGESVWLRAVDVERDVARRLVDRVTREGRRPEPLRVAREASRACLDYVEAS